MLSSTVRTGYKSDDVSEMSDEDQQQVEHKKEKFENSSYTLMFEKKRRFFNSKHYKKIKFLFMIDVINLSKRGAD